MSSDWVQDAEGRWKRATIHRMGRRLSFWDYRRPGTYVITIVLENRRSRALGELVVLKPGEEGAWVSVDEARQLELPPEEIEAKVVFSELGRAIFEHFRPIGEFTPGLRPVFCAVMPDHLHLIVKIERELERPLGNAIGGFKTGCEKIYRSMGGEGRLFAEGFVDEIVLRAGQLAREFNYVLDNPRRLAVKRLYPDLFKYSRRIGVALRLAQKEQAGRAAALQGPAGREAGRLVSQGEAGRGDVRLAPMARAIGWFSAIGNHFLLERPIVQVQVSRRFFRYRRVAKPGAAPSIARDARGEPEVEFSTGEYEKRRDELLLAASHGAVLLSPCVSDGERQIAHEALALGFRLVTMHNKGFSRLQKPSGRYFDACAEGRLLMLAPAAWPHQPGEKPMTRLDATTMNRVCQWLAGDGAADVNYNGQAPADIDALAFAALQVEGHVRQQRCMV